jgi:hypothetical protein
MFHTELIMPVAFFQELQISAIPILPFPLLHLPLHDRQITAQPEALTIAEPDIVIRLAFSELHALGFEACAQLFEGAVEEMREEKEGGALIEAVAVFVDQAASAAGEGVLFQDCDFEAGFS